MKKFVLLFSTVVLLSAVVFAQSLSLSDTNGVSVANNTTINIQQPPTSEAIASCIWVINNSAIAVDVKVKKVEISLTDGHYNTFCWDVCYPPNIYESIGTVRIGIGETFKLFTGDLTPNGIVGTDLIRYVFFVDGNTTDSVCYNVNFFASTQGINDPVKKHAELSNAYPNPAINNTSLSYTLPKEVKNAEIRMYNLTGSVVKKIVLNEKEGRVTISTSELNTGLYYFTLVADHNVIITRKVIISK